MGQGRAEGQGQAVIIDGNSARCSVTRAKGGADEGARTGLLSVSFYPLRHAPIAGWLSGPGVSVRIPCGFVIVHSSLAYTTNSTPEQRWSLPIRAASCLPAMLPIGIYSLPGLGAATPHLLPGPSLPPATLGSCLPSA